MPTDYHELRKKYPKWAHRKDEYRKRRRKSRRRRRRTQNRGRRLQKRGTAESTETMLVSLLHQLMAPTTLAKKHGENVLTGMAGKVKPDYLSPLWSQHERNFIHSRAARSAPEQGGAAAGGAAAAVIGPAQGAWGWA